MPHCIVEYAKDLETQIDLNELMTTTHFSVFSSGIFEEEDIKTRLIPYELYRTGTNEKPFVHITLRILPGRTEQQKICYQKYYCTILLLCLILILHSVLR